MGEKFFPRPMNGPKGKQARLLQGDAGNRTWPILVPFLRESRSFQRGRPFENELSPQVRTPPPSPRHARWRALPPRPLSPLDGF